MLRRYLLAAVSLLVSVGVSTAQAPNSTPPPAATESPAQETMEDPQVGDHWTYDFRDDITGDVKWTYTDTVTDVTAMEISVRTATTGNSQSGSTSYDRSWNRTRNDTFRFAPNDGGGIRTPLAVGKTWSARANDVNTGAGVSWKRSVTAKVVAQESVTTRAGTFDTFKIEMSLDYQSSKDPTRKQQETVQTWYAPAIDHWVKRSSVSRSEGRVREKSTVELVEYGRR